MKKFLNLKSFEIKYQVSLYLKGPLSLRAICPTKNIRAISSWVVHKNIFLIRHFSFGV